MFEKQRAHISNYFSEEFIKAVEQYENLVHFSVNENQKDRDLLVLSKSTEHLRKKSFSDLRHGPNPDVSIEAFCLRALVCQNVTYILAV
jgi:hypothetical protein